MKSVQKYCLVSMTAALLVVSAGCSNMSSRGQNTAIGAGVGALGGAVLTGGDAWGTIGGAAAGGVIGNIISD